MKARYLAIFLIPIASLILAACEDSPTPDPFAGGGLSPTSDGVVPTIPGGIILPDPNSTPNIISDAGRLAATETPASGGSAPAGDQALVVDVIDGDTIDVEFMGSAAAPTRVRYIGVNTPERDEPCYAEATQANGALVLGQILTLVRDVSDTDRYGRLLRYIYAGQTFVNAELVRQGWAEAVDYPPDTLNAPLFHSLADSAKASGLGCWPSGVFNN